MSVIFTSTIKMLDGSDEEWYIELKDMVDSRVINCKNLEEYEQKIEELGQDYGGNIDAVNWYKDANVAEYVMDDVRLQMSKFEKPEEVKNNKKIIILLYILCS